MRHTLIYRSLLLTSFVFTAQSPAVLAVHTEGSKFSDRDRLVSTLLSDEEAELSKAQTGLDGASADDLAALQAELAAAQANLTSAQQNLDEERANIEELLGQLSEEQVVALNRALNNVVSSGLIVNIDAEHLQSVLDGEYNKRQINALTKALEEEAKFTRLSDKSLEKYEATGNPKFLAQSERFLQKGASQKEKFLAKITRFDSTNTLRMHTSKAATQAAKAAAKQEAKKAAKSTAKNAAKSASKEAAKDVAKGQAKANAKQVAKQAVKQVIREESKKAAKDKAKDS